MMPEPRRKDEREKDEREKLEPLDSADLVPPTNQRVVGVLIVLWDEVRKGGSA